MKAKKKNKPLNFATALTHAKNNTFQYLESPPADLVERLLRRNPQLIFAVPQATKEMQIACIKCRGDLLLTYQELKFDVEAVFPGSTAFLNHYKGQFLSQIFNADFSNLAQSIILLMETEWQRFARLSDWGDQLGKTEREILKSFEYEEARTFVDALLENGPPHLRTSNTDSEYFGASLNDAMEFA
jgi:hypothetical protein